MGRVRERGRSRQIGGLEGTDPACSIRVSTGAFVGIQRNERKRKCLKFFRFNTETRFEPHPLRHTLTTENRALSSLDISRVIVRIFEKDSFSFARQSGDRRRVARHRRARANQCPGANWVGRRLKIGRPARDQRHRFLSGPRGRRDPSCASRGEGRERKHEDERQRPRTGLVQKPLASNNVASLRQAGCEIVQ